MKTASCNCFLFLGPELGEKFDALNALRTKLQTEETGFFAGETPLREIVSFLKNGSLFSESRLVIIKNAEFITKKDELELLVSAILQLEANTTLVLISEETRLDKRIEDAVPRSNKIIFWELFENKKNDWVGAFFRRAGCSIDESGIGTILELVENNTDALSRECSRLILFLGKDKTVTGEVVEQCLSHTREESVFTLFAAIARGNLLLSLEILRSLSESKLNVQAITAALAWCFRKLQSYMALSIGAGDAELRKIGISSSRARSDYSEAAKRWPRPEGALALLAEYEYLFRSSGSVWEEILLDRLIFHLARGMSPK
ncbi:MAG: DNA polymerase III subunit delta [Treponema sp.]|jgi:DNA polymerase-3 subunit delta|nr:DNA polymerase III subunit delta [Treponema sp.]